jgi:Mor family transcriptional regulator
MANRSNLRLPPLFLRASVVRGLIADLQGIHHAVVQVPLLPTKLVDMPRASEDPRLAKASDDHEIQSLSRLPVQESGLERMARRGGVSLKPTGEWSPEAKEASPHPIPEITEPAAAQVGRAAPKSQSDLGCSERANDSEEGTRARPTDPQPRVRKSRATGVKAATDAARAARNSALLAAYAAGGEVEELAKQFGVSVFTVREIAWANGLKRKIGKPFSAEIAARNQQVAAAFTAGEPIGAMITRFQLSRANIYKIVELAGAKRPAKAPKPPREPKPRRVKAPKPPRQPKIPRIRATKSAATGSAMGDSADLRTQAPEGSSGGVVGGPVNAPANACEQHVKPYASGMLGPDAEAPEFKRPRPRLSQADEPRPEAPAPVLSDAAFERAEPAPKPAPDVRGMAARLAAKRAAERKLDPARVADAFARRAATKAAQAPVKPAPLLPAPSREECLRCGVPGWKGCDHWLPCEGARA